LFEDARTHTDLLEREHAGLLLELLTPVVKSWPARYGCVSNELAIQVLGGAGYIREHPVEQLYRDQRLNPIHEGAEAIHGIDLVGRKLSGHNGQAKRLLVDRIQDTIDQARRLPRLASHAATLGKHVAALHSVSEILLKLVRRDPDRALSNATVYLDAFGRVTVAWLWLQQACVATRALDGDAGRDADFYKGKLQAARYYFEWELPQSALQWDLLTELNAVPYEMQSEWF
jgi:butyryl-CoA dehydrogenase